MFLIAKHFTTRALFIRLPGVALTPSDLFVPGSKPIPSKSFTHKLYSEEKNTKQATLQTTNNPTGVELGLHAPPGIKKEIRITDVLKLKILSEHLCVRKIFLRLRITEDPACPISPVHEKLCLGDIRRVNHGHPV